MAPFPVFWPKTPPLHGIHILVSHHLNDHSPLTQWVYLTASAHILNRGSIPSPWGSVFNIAGQNRHPSSISQSQLLTISMTAPPSPNESPPPSPPTVSMPD